MKNLLVVFVILFSSNLMSQSYVWAKNMGGLGSDAGCSIALDDSGNVFTTGNFQSTADFDPGIGVSNLTAVGDDDIFISKLDPSGNFIWAKSIGGLNVDHGISITTDASGNVYTTGFFSGAVDFDPGVGITNLTSGGNYDIFVSKLDANGNFMWAKSIGGPSSDYGSTIIIDDYGNVYTTGVFSGTVDFNPGVGVFNMSTNSSFDAFILKLDANGNFVWVKSMVGTQNVEGIAIATDTTGNVYTTGQFKGTADFDPGVGINNLTAATASVDIFISKLDSSGNFIWVKTLTGSNGGNVYSITVDDFGNVHTIGYFLGTFDFDPGLGISNHSSTGGVDTFISKLDSSGNFIWAKTFGDTLNDIGHSMTLDVSGNVYVTGIFQGTVDFDPGVGISNLSSAGVADIYISKLDPNGNYMWAIRMGSTGQDLSYSIAVDTFGNIHTTGVFRNTVDFNPGIGVSNLMSAGNYNVFVSKLGLCQANYGIDSVLACGDYRWIDSITYVSNNNSATDTILNFNGCDSIVTLNLTINLVDTSVNYALPNLTANANGASYQWLDCLNNMNTISGENNQIFTPTLNGQYAVLVTENGCMDTSSCYSVFNIGINENINDFIRINPNPVSSIFTIEGFNHSYNLSIYNSLGQLLYTEKNIIETSKRVDVSKYSKGLIFIRIESDGDTYYHKVIKD